MVRLYFERKIERSRLLYWFRLPLLAKAFATEFEQACEREGEGGLRNYIAPARYLP